jgi:hypothetical protein
MSFLFVFLLMTKSAIDLTELPIVVVKNKHSWHDLGPCSPRQLKNV